MTEAATIPKKFGNYRVLEEVGVGGLGRVFRGIDERNGQTVAVKILHDRFTNSRKFLGIFHRELLIISRLHHKHIVSYLDSGFEPPNCYIVTEFVEGWSCHNFFKKVRKIPPLVALSIVMDILQGIDHLHLHDTIHSDLSMANVMIEKTGRVLVTDFGLACQLEIEDYKNYMIGTPGYYSPEHITEAAIVPQTDIYCSGLILFELITGVKAVPPSQDRGKILQGMKNIPLERVVCSDPKMQVLLRKLLKATLTLSANRRIPTAEAMMFEIYKVLKRYNIRYTRYAVKKYLIDSGLIHTEPPQTQQDIYFGAA